MNNTRAVPLSAIALALMASMVGPSLLYAQAKEASKAPVVAAAPEPDAITLPEPLSPNPKTPEFLHERPAKDKESVRPAPALTPLESKTPAEAASRAADPRAPTGALIVLPRPKD